MREKQKFDKLNSIIKQKQKTQFYELQCQENKETSHRLEENIAKYSSDKWLVSKNTKNLMIRKIHLRNELKILTDKSPKKIAEKHM